jgi:hypothetical protein
MSLIADYTIVSDAWVLQYDTDTVNFTVPSNIHTGSRTILGFMLHVDNQADLTLKLNMNGSQIWSRTFESGDRIQFFQEVVTAGVVKPGKNVFTFKTTSDDYNLVELSDIVLWWQASI